MACIRRYPPKDKHLPSMPKTFYESRGHKIVAAKKVAAVEKKKERQAK